MNRILVILGVTLIVVLTALFALPALIDWSRYRSSFEEQASRLMGRPVRVGDHVRLGLLPSPYISFDNVRVADASGRFDTPLLRMESFKLQLAVGPLLSGNLVAQDVELTAPALRLSVGPDGQGNWVGLGHPVAGAAAADLKGLALNAVRIDRGSVELVGTAGQRALHVEAISGDLDAPTLQGPFRFKGTFANAGTQSELRFSAAEDDASRKFRIKSTWRSGADGAQSYSVDGLVDGLAATPSLTGSIEGQFALAPAQDKKAAASAIEFKANLLATADSAKLTGLDILLDSDGRPQHVNGSATLSWREGLTSEADLSAATLDLDRLADGRINPSPLQTAKALLERLTGAASAAKDAHVKLRIADATVGGGAVSAVTLVAQLTGHGLAIESLSAKLPGQSHLDTSGELTDQTASVKFDGTMRLWGANFAALANWAMPGLAMPDTGNGSTFLIDSAMSAGPEHLLAEKLRLEISGTTVTGSVRYSAAQPQALSVVLDSGRLDLTRLLETPLNLAAIAAPPEDAGPAAAAAAGDGPWTVLRSVMAGDTHLDLRIGHLITAQGSLRDVVAKLDRSSGRLNIPTIDLATDEGFRLHLEGALQAKGSDGQGQLRLMLEAADQRALAGAIKFAGLTAAFEGYDTRLAPLLPMTLAGTIAIGANSATSQEIALDGSANGSRLTAVLRRDGEDADWLGSQVDVAADLANADSARLLTQIAGVLGSPQVPGPALAPQAVPGKLVLRSSGVPDDSMTTVIALDSDAATARFDGQATYGAKGQIGLEGHLDVDAQEAMTALRFARLERLEPVLRGPLKLSGRLHRDADMLGLTGATASLAGAPFTGEGRLTGGQPVPKLEISLQAPALRLNQLLGLLVASGDASQAATEPTSVWPGRPFDFAVTEELESHLSATTARLVLTDGLTLSDAKISLTSKPGSVELAVLQGHAMSGDVSGEAKLTKGPAGAALQVQAALSKAHLDSLGTDAAGLPRPGGDFGLTLNVSGSGLSPRDLAASVAGKGSFSLGDGGIARFGSGTIDTAAREALAVEPGLGRDTVRAALAKARLAGDFPMLGASGSLAISDGSIRFDRLKVESSQSGLEIANRIDLSTLQLASVWALQPKPAQSDKQALPLVTFNFTGPLADFGKVEPLIETADLERDLTTRKLLGGPEQLQGIWPTGLTPAPSASIAAAPVIVPPPQDPPAAPAIAVAAPAVPLPGTTGSLPAADQNAAALDAAAKKAASPPARPRRKKTDWASALFQNLFGK